MTETLPEVPLKTEDGTRFTVGLVTKDYEVNSTKGQRTLIPFYDERFLDVFAEMLREYPKAESNVTVLYTGPMTVGKSTLTIQVARKVSPDFPQWAIAFRIAEFNDALARLPISNYSQRVFSQLQFDESGYDLYSQNWMDRVQRNIVRKFEVIGAKKTIVHFDLPHRELFNNKLREGPIDYWINVSKLKRRRGLAELREGIPNIWHLNKYWKPLCAFAFPQLDDDFYQSYRKRKLSFIEEVLSEKDDEKEEGHSAIVRQRNLLIETLRDLTDKSGEKMTLEEIGRVIGVSESTISRSLNLKRKGANK
jgi:hypothetical protein